MTKEQLWEATLGEIELQIAKNHFNTWFKNTFIIDGADDTETATIAVPGAFHQEYIEKNYKDKIIKILLDLSSGNIKKIAFIVKAKKTTADTLAKTTTKSQEMGAESKGGSVEVSLNIKYSFSSYIVGKGNELAYAACQAVARKPGETYNPLFLYGGVGLGKTHLLQAIGNEVKKERPGTRVLYLTSERFTNEFIQSVRSGEADKFKQLYRSVDILLVDDVQFLAGKEQTQEEFFHTFNALHQNNKQIVLTSDRPPKAIAALEGRLISRLEWGMIADIAAPDLETRIAILENKCKDKNLKLPRDVIQYVAAHVHNNVRELEGVLNSIVASSQLHATEPTLETIKPFLTSLRSNQKASALTAKEVIQIVANYYNIPHDAIVGSSRKKEFVAPRQVAMYLLREELKSSYPNIGACMGDRDHTTAMYGCERIEKLLQEDDRAQEDVNTIRQQLYVQ